MADSTTPLPDAVASDGGADGAPALPDGGGAAAPAAVPAAVTEEDCAEALLCARYGETDDLLALLAAKVSVDHRDPHSLSTCLHYAAANGHLDCVKALVQHRATYVANASGNFPLHWALEQSNSPETVRLLMDTYPEIDVLKLNSFGKSALTSSFKTNNKELVNMVLAHDSAAPLDQSRPKESVAPKRGDVAVTHQMAFLSQALLDAADPAAAAAAAPLVHVRERAIDARDDDAVFGAEMQASEDTTGLALWPASIVLSHWVADEATRELLRGKRVVELGAGCGLPGLVAAAYTPATAVVLTDFFPETMTNLRHNLAINQGTAGAVGRPRPGLAACSVHGVDWADTAAWAADPATAAPFDVVIGADLVYHDDVLAIFIATLQHVLRDGGRFLYVSRERRGGMALLGPALEMAGFTLRRRQEAPAAYRRNPMPAATQEYCDTYFKNLTPASGQSFELFHYTYKLEDEAAEAEEARALAAAGTPPATAAPAGTATVGTGAGGDGGGGGGAVASEAQVEVSPAVVEGVDGLD